jgi:Tfp pilus assembly PilM family ATPase/Tfp pilus assembly protein PilN
MMSSASVYLELGQSSLKALKGEAGLELPLERLPNGRLSEVCKNNLVLRLQSFLKLELWQPRMRALCAVGARGVSLRRLTLPASTKENLRRLLLLQIESEFPLPPDALAWGYHELPTTRLAPAPGLREPAPAAGKQDFLIVAVKKEVIQEYWELLSGCGVVPVFTLAGMARRLLQPQLPATCALLDIGRDYSELMAFENGVPTSVRILPWGGESITRAMAQALGINQDEAEKLKLSWAQGSLADGETRAKLQAAFEAALDSLTPAIHGHWSGPTLYLSGRSARLKDLPSQLAQRLGAGVRCESLEPPAGDGRSAATLGLKAAAESGKECPPLVIQLTPANGTAGPAQRDWMKWAALAAALALASLAFPYVEALLLKSRLSRKLAAVQTDKARLSTIDRELDFLRYLKQSQPPYLDALFLLSKAAPQGARLDSLSMNRRGDLSLRGSMKDAQQVAGFRSKLIESGFFANVSVEEQTPTPDRQKLVVRMSAQWKPAAERAALAIGPTPEEIAKAKTRPKEPPGGAFPAMGPGFPSGPPTLVGPPADGPGRRFSSSRNSPGPPSPSGMRQ